MSSTHLLFSFSDPGLDIGLLMTDICMWVASSYPILYNPKDTVFTNFFSRCGPFGLALVQLWVLVVCNISQENLAIGFCTNRYIYG
jgi:hypothetical protein